MKKQLRAWIGAMIFTASFGGMALTVAAPQTAAAACADRLLTFPTWYRGVSQANGDGCDIKSPASMDPDPNKALPKFIWTIILNVIEVMLQLVGYISVAFIITGGFKYITSTGTPDDIVKARKTILNAVVGLVLSIFSVAIVNLVAGAI